jgi:outer membrane autotransporter protein
LVIGAELGGAMDMGWRNKLVAQLKLGWGHEFASTDRPVTAAFAGAPAVPFTTFGAAPNRDGVVLGFNATTAIAERTSLFVRYEGQVSGADNMHSGTIGVRFTW